MAKYALYIVNTPNKRFTLVGSIPRELCLERVALKSDILSGRCYQDKESGQLKAWYIPGFDTLEDAVTYCSERGANHYKISIV